MSYPRQADEPRRRAAIASTQASRIAPRRDLKGRLLADVSVGLLVISIVLAGFIFQGVGRPTYQKLKAGTLVGNDFPALYSGARNIVSARSRQTYKSEAIVQSILEVTGYDRSQVGEEARWLRYYNPPFFLLALSPLTLLDLHIAYLAVFVANLLALLALAFVLGHTLRWRQPITSLLLVALLSFIPVYFAVIHGQPTILIAVLFSSAYLVIERNRRFLGAALLALTGVKPQWLILPVIAALRRDRPLLIPFLVAAILILLVPFVSVGVGGLVDYVTLLTGRGEADLNDLDFSSAVLSWAGFLRAATGSVQPLAWVGLTLATLAVFAAVLWRGDSRLVWAAAAMASLIVVPHSHPQDWVMAAPAAALLLSRPMRPQLTALTAITLLAVYLGANSWVMAKQSVLDGGRAIYWATPAAFTVVLWCAVLPWVEERIERRARTLADVTPVTAQDPASMRPPAS